MASITISSGEIILKAELLDTPTARAIEKALPFEGRVNVWGEEIYFPIPVALEQEPEAREEVEVGELGYWPVGKAFCIFFGPTPVSTGEKPHADSPVNVFGKLLDDPGPLKNLQSGDIIHVK